MSPLGAAWRTTVRASNWAVGAGSPDRWNDVWSRAGSKYRNRAAVLLVIDLLLFTGLCMFTYWLRTGLYLPFHGQDYFTLLLRSFKISGPEQVSLADMLVGPISVERTPMQMVILAMVMAALVSVPVLVAILYRFPFALPFAAIIAFVAVLPWLGITGVLACVLASVRPFRLHFRFASALLGMIPFGIYLWMSLNSGSQALPVSSPVEQFKMYAPWALSMMAACFNLAVVLLLASLVGYRPGVISPVLALLFAAPVVLFEANVGQDELYYSVLETRYGPASPDCFKAGSIVQFIAQQPEAFEVYSRIYGPMNEPLESVRAQWRMNLPAVQPLKQKVEQVAIADLEQDRGEVIEQASQFITDFPNSRRVPAALYLQGKAMDTQLDIQQLRRDGSVSYYDDFPGQLSNAVWQALAGSSKNHPLATVARYKLAVQALRQGKTAEALELLRQVEAFAQNRRARPDAPSQGWFALLMPRPEEASTLGVDVEDVALQARQLRELVEANAGDPKYGAQPISLLFRMDPHSVQYRDNLLWLDERFPGALLHDNLQLLLVLTNPSLSVRINYLERHLSVYKGQDSIPQALYELGRLLEQDARFVEAIDRYDAVTVQFPESVWRQQAAQREAALKLSLGK